MKLDVNALRYLSKDEFRVLTAVEMGMKNHEIVPSELIDRIAGLKTGGAYKNMRLLLRHKLVHHDSSKYDGYRLTTLGYDFLAIKTLANRGLIAGVGRQIGVGKESDIFEVVTDDGQTLALKLHRLGRTSFRAVKTKRDYLKHRNSYNWLYLSRLAALKEYAFMKALGEHGFPVPKAVDWNRHCVLMTLVEGYPLVQVKELRNPLQAFETIIDLIERLAQHGLIHCDFNEFNIMVGDDESITMIDFPQMVSVSHQNAEMYFDRDVNCIYKFFSKRFNFSPEKGDVFDSEEEEDKRPAFADLAGIAGTLDKELAASGFTHQSQEILEQYAEDVSQDDCAPCSDEDSLPAESNVVTIEREHGTSDSEALLSTSLTLCQVDTSNGSDELQQAHCSTSESEDVPSPGCNSDLQKQLQKQRRRAASAVRGGGHLHSSRNSTKDKGGRRSRYMTSKVALDY